MPANGQATICTATNVKVSPSPKCPLLNEVGRGASSAFQLPDLKLVKVSLNDRPGHMLRQQIRWVQCAKALVETELSLPQLFLNP